MKSALTPDCSSARRLVAPLSLFMGLAQIVFSPDVLLAQTVGAGSRSSAKPQTPVELPASPNFRIPGHDGYSISKGVGEPLTQGLLDLFKGWELSLSALYEFSSQRSKLGGLSLDTDAVTVDFGARRRICPFTTIDISYSYAHATGSSPNGGIEVANQHIGFVRLLQPLNEIWKSGWKPPDLGYHSPSDQWAIILGTAYGGSPSVLTMPNSLFLHSNGRSFFEQALLDYQIAFFSRRDASAFSSNSDPTAHNYPSWLIEFSSGGEFQTVRVDSSNSTSAKTSSARQWNYVNIGSLTYSFASRLGFEVAVEWDAPLVSKPLSNSRPDHASTATVAAGLVYNVYPDKSDSNHASFWNCLFDGNRWSASLLYSYTAFDPLTETNALQLQISYAF
jgi:hypothetical protein